MASVAILVNGLPGSGKTTVATTLGAVLDCPVLTRDLVKERFGDLLGPRADSRRLGALAADTLWRLAAETDGGVVIDAPIARRDLPHVERGLVTAGSPRTVELWCEIPVELARQRFLDRGSRHPVHTGWDEAFEGMEPLGAWPLLRVDTAHPVDIDALVIDLERLFTA